jgi:hypothetical protein
MAYTINTDLTLSGATIAMGTNKITGLGTPTAGTDATTKTYVDDAVTAGVVSLFSEDASRNIVGGAGAGGALAAGALDNYIAGNGAGAVISTGDNNILIGSRAGALIQTALQNIGIGVDTMTVNVSSPNNISLGKNSLIGLLSGTGSNIAIGTNGQVAVTTGNGNISVGDQSLGTITDGIRNTAYGKGAGVNASGTSNDNIFLGNQAGPTVSGAISDKLYIHNAQSDTPLIGGNFSTSIVTVNGALVVTGTLDASVTDLGEFVIASLPAAGTNANSYALATDASGGRTVVRSDGTNWKVIALEGATVTV